jgi:hypothetical protein
MVNIYVLMVFFGFGTEGKATEQVMFPHRAECEYAAETINKEVDGARAFCFDVRVAGDRHEEPSGLSQQ